MAKLNSPNIGDDYGAPRILYALVVNEGTDAELMVGYFQDYQTANERGSKSGKKYRILSQTI
jgi:hypothetical protein